MKISTRVRYGLRALIYIAEKTHNENRLVRIKEISESQKISIQYLEQILFRLKKEGIIEGKRGPHGGYKLMKDPADINILNLYEILDSEAKVVDCNENSPTCVSDECKTSCLWGKLDESLSKILKETSLEELMNQNKIV